MKKKLLLLALAFTTLTGFWASAQTYCTTGVGPTSTIDSEILNVQITGDNFSILRSEPSTCGPTGVQDFTATDSADVSQGTSYTLNITFGDCNGGSVYTGYGVAWIDWNNDGDFVDAGEELGSWGPGSPDPQGTVTYNSNMSFTVPVNATLGTTRLRVMQRESGSATTTTPCAGFTYGGVEDYTIVVTNTPPPCPIPGLPSASNISGTSATIMWSSTGTKFDIEYGPLGFTPGTGSMDSTTTTTYQMSNLTNNTSYDVYVRNNCVGGGNGLSSWSGPVSFTTTCGSISTYPYTESFDDSLNWTPSTGFPYNSTIDNCWDRNPDVSSSFHWVCATGGTPSTGTGPSGDNSSSGNGNFLYVEGSNGGTDAYITLPAFDLSSLTVPFFTFYWHRFGTDVGPFDLEVSTDTGSTWTSVMSLTGPSQTANGDPYTEEIVDLTTYKSSHTLVRFKMTKIGGFSTDMAIDDVSMAEAPPCPKPTAFSFSNISATGVTLNFLSNGSSFPIEYGPVGFTQGTGMTDTATATGHMLSGLFGNTQYDVYIQNDCSGSGNGLSAWAGPYTFRTLCNAFPEGYFNNFDATASGDLDPCWAELSYGAAHDVYSLAPFAFSQVQPVSTPNLLYWYNAFATWSYVITPEFMGLDGDTTQIRFKMTNNYFTSATNINVFVGTMSDRSDTSTIQWVDTILTTNRSWADYTMLLDNVPTGHKFVVFARDNSVTFSEVDIENFYFEGIPSCLPPTSGSAQATSSTSISVSWVGPGTSYDVEYGVQGFTQGTGSIDTNVTTPYAISNLAPNTCYDAYVRTNCGNGSVSPWFGPITVCTPCNPSAMPYSEDFATWPPACFSFDNTTNWDWDQDPAGHARARFWNFNGGTAFMTSGPVSISQKARVKFSWAHAYLTFYPNDRLVFLARVQGSPVWDTLINLNGPTFTSPNATNTQPPALTDFMEEKFNLDSATYNGNVAEFMFAATSGFGPNLFVDDFIVEAQPLCTEPDQVNVSNITGFTADLNWNSSVGSLFEIEYGPQGFTPGTGSATIDTTASMPYTFTGLTPVTCYDVYIRTLCGANGNSVLTGPIGFCTAVSCPAPTNIQLVSAGQSSATLSWTTGSASNWNYVNVAQGFGPGAGTIMFNGTNPQTVTGLSSGTGYSFYVRDSCGPGDVSAWTGPFDYVTPLCDTAQQCDYTVYMHDSYGDGWNGYEFGLAVGGTTLETFGETFVSSGGFPPTDFEDTAYISACNGYPADVVIHQSGGFANEVSFEIVSSSGDTVFALALGSLGTTSPLGSFTPNCIPISCPLPDSLMATNITATSADLSWNSPSNGNSFQVSWGQPPFQPTSGTIVATTTTTTSLTTLMGNTVYGYYVREICGVGDTSLWAGPYSFATLCTTTNLPFSENLDGVQWIPDNTAFGPTFNDAIDQCWSRSNASGNFNWAVRSTTTGSGSTGPSGDVSGTGNYIFTEASSPAATGEVAELVSPVIDMSLASNAELKFHYHMYGADMGRLAVDGFDGTSWIPIDSIVGQQQTSSADPWRDTTLSLAAFTNANFQFRFRGIRGAGFTSDMAIDEVTINSVSACPDPTNVMVSNKTCTTMEVTWTSVSGTTMSSILYGAAGFDPTTSGTLILPATSPETITGLMIGTAYDVYVIDSCSLGLSNPIKITDTTANGPLPVAAFTASPNAGSHPDTVRYTFSALPSGSVDSYWWDYGDGSPNDTDVFTIHDYTVNGTYTVTLVVTNECGSDTATQQIVIEGIDIEESVLGRSLSIYPNPTAGQFKVEFDVDGRQEIAIRVMDALGRIVESMELGFVNGPQELTMDLNGNASGIYLIQIDSKDGSITKRVTLRNK